MALVQAQKLSSDVIERKADIDRLLRMQQVIESAGSKSTSRNTPSGLHLPVMSESAKPIAVDEIAAWIKDCPLLTAAGKTEFSRLATLVLSGALPVISGPDGDDVVAMLGEKRAGSVNTRKVELCTRTDPGRPAAGDGLHPGVEAHAFGSMHVMVPK